MVKKPRAARPRTRIAAGPSRAKPRTRRTGVLSRRATTRGPGRDQDEVVTVPVLADGADPGRTVPSTMAVRDRLVVDRRLVQDYGPDRLFAYEVSPRDMGFLRGLASPGDRIVFRRGGRVAPGRICAVRTQSGVVLARVEFRGHSLVLLPGDGARTIEPLELENVQGLAGVVAGTHVLLIRR
jgi:hypothetical protein